ncbi:hypothetical protein M1614_01305 [Candidatus Marsarchaeota archaeon]|nr:hypothetical protein [Candidatus Marsarchaeota archaeon]MCL5090198.1 hypothetical protein [Candidatus Marsarchaeota archaeon]
MQINKKDNKFAVEKIDNLDSINSFEDALKELANDKEDSFARTMALEMLALRRKD